MNRPRSLTASVATSMIKLAAVSASAAGSAHTVKVASEAMVRSYPLVQPALAFERFSVSNVVCVVRHERLPGGLTGRGEIGQSPERLQGEQRGAPARRLGLDRPGDRMPDRVGDHLSPHARMPQGATRGHDGVSGGGAGREQVVYRREPKRDRLQSGACDLD